VIDSFYSTTFVYSTIAAAMNVAPVIMVEQPTTVINVIGAGLPVDMVAGSIIDASPDITTIALACLGSVQDCGFTDTVTLFQGPSTFAADWSYSNEEYGSNAYTFDCQIDQPADEITCTVEVTASWDGTETTQSTVDTTDLSSYYAPLTITAGLDLLEPSPEATPTGHEATQTDDVDAEVQETGTNSETDSFLAPFRPTPTDLGSDPDDDDDDDEDENDATTAGPSAVSTAAPLTTTPASLPSIQTQSTSSSLPTTTTADADNVAPMVVTQRAVVAGMAVVLGAVMLL
jgi:hypothetical protein